MAGSEQQQASAEYQNETPEGTKSQSRADAVCRANCRDVERD